MTKEIEKSNLKKIMLFIIGGIMLVLGIALILNWWVYLIVVFKGAIGILLALIGLLILFISK